ncbi:MAG: hypothetical protein Q9210_007233, partial [Variospora velana]
MRFPTILSVIATASLVLARSPRHVGKKDFQKPAQKLEPRQREFPQYSQNQNQKRQSSYLNPSSRSNDLEAFIWEQFVVNGTAIPDVDFDIGESYAGLLPISSASNETRELYFCSLEGLLQENGPFLWQYGTFAPVKNPYTWVNLTNMVWIEQPVGTGFSQGTPTATNEDEVAEQFLGFFKNFVDTFALQGRKVYITGESYAGYYVPYIANAMLNANDTTYYDVRSIMIYDPSTSTDAVQEQ